MADVRESIRGLVERFKQLPATQKFLIITSALGLIIILGVASVYLAQPNYSILYSGLSQEDMVAILTELDKEGVKYKIGKDGRTILVPEGQVRDIRLKLSAKGIPSKGIIGYEIFDKTGIGISNFQQQVNYKRAIEGELVRTILRIKNITDARVHIAIPEKSIFLREEEEPSASVFIKLKPGTDITREQIIAIRNLVASSVERLRPSNVVIIDDRGRDLTALLDEGDEFKGVSEKQLKIVSEFERKLEKKILKALSETIGYDKVKVVVSAEMDFTKMEKKEEIYDPDMTAVVSQQKKKERTTGTGIGGIPGATANIPPGAGAGGGGTINTEKSEVTTNFEVSKKEIYTADYAPKIKRISVGVLIDKNAEKDVDLKKLEDMIVAAAGLNVERGDKISIVSVPFQKPEFVEYVDYSEYVRWGVYAFMALLAFIAFVILMRKLGRRERVTVKAPPTPAKVPTAGELESVAGLEAIREKAKEVIVIDTITNIAKEEPNKVAKIIKSWLKETR